MCLAGGNGQRSLAPGNIYISMAKYRFKHLTPRIKEFFDEFFVPATDRGAPELVLLNALYTQLSMTACSLRLREHTGRYPMMHGWHFAPMGMYKDRPYKQMATLVLGKMLDRQRQDKVAFRDMQMKWIDAKASTYKEGNQRDKFLADNKSLWWKNIYEEGTAWGLWENLHNCQVAGIGSVHVKHSEVASYMKQYNSPFFDLQRMCMTIMEDGHAAAPQKMGLQREDIDDIPITKSYHSTFIGITEDLRTWAKLRTLFMEGDARRSVVLYLPERYIVKMSKLEKDNDDVLVEKNKVKWADWFLKIYELNAPIRRKNYSEADFKLGIKLFDQDKRFSARLVDELLHEYKTECADRSIKVGDEVVAGNIKDRFKVVFMLSCLGALFEHPDDFDPRPEDFLLAKDFVEMAGATFERMYGLRPDDKKESLWIEMVDGKEINKTDMSYKAGIRGNTDFLYMTGWLDSKASENGMMLLSRKGSGPSRFYRLEKMPEHGKLDSDRMIEFSIGKSGIPAEATFTPMICKWSEIGKYLTDNGHSWSAGVFKDNYRKGQNILSIPSLIVLDIDNSYPCPQGSQITLDEVKSAFSRFEYLIYTTKSHQIEKVHKTYSDPKADRCRVVLLAERPLPTNASELRRMYDGIVREFFPWSHPASIDIKAMGDVARYYFGNPGEVSTNHGEVMDWMMYMPDEEGKMQFGTVRTIDKSKIIPHGTVWEGKTGPVTIQDARNANGKSIAVKCNVHPDTHASAWLAVNRNGNVQFCCSVSSCGALMFEK